MLIFELIVIAMLVSCAAVVPGMFLVLRKTALVSDAVSHAVLLGIATLFLIVRELHSGFLLFGAVFAGMLAVGMIEFLTSRRYIRSDAAMGIVFPLFFSIGVILISRYARHVHLDTDMVMLGELAFAPLTRLTISGIDYGPQVAWTLGALIVIQILVISVLYKELVVSCWDAEYAKLIGLKPRFLYYCIVLLTSVTSVLSFESVGSIIVVALMITPPATALLISRTMRSYVAISIVVAVCAAVLGTSLGWFLNVSLAGSVASCAGLIFMVVWISRVISRKLSKAA